MKTTHKKIAGFSHTAVLLVLVIIGALSFAGFKVHNSSKQASKTSAATVMNTAKQIDLNPPLPKSSPNMYADWKQYTSVKGGLSFKYPAEWVVSEEEHPSDPNTGNSYLSIFLNRKTPCYGCSALVSITINKGTPEMAANSWYDMQYNGCPKLIKQIGSAKGVHTISYTSTTDKDYGGEYWATNKEVEISYLLERESKNDTVAFESVMMESTVNPADNNNIVIGSKGVFETLNFNS